MGRLPGASKGRQRLEVLVLFIRPLAPVKRRMTIGAAAWSAEGEHVSLHLHATGGMCEGGL